MHHEIVIFDHGPTEFPIATLRPRDSTTRARVVLLDAARWLASMWQWFRPRMVPVVVAVLGATLVLASAEYLSHGHGTLRSSPSPLSVSSTIAAP